MRISERRDALKDLLDTIQFLEYIDTNPACHLHPPSSPNAELEDSSDQLTMDILQLDTSGKVENKILS